MIRRRAGLASVFYLLVMATLPVVGQHWLSLDMSNPVGIAMLVALAIDLRAEASLRLQQAQVVSPEIFPNVHSAAMACGNFAKRELRAACATYISGACGAFGRLWLHLLVVKSINVPGPFLTPMYRMTVPNRLSSKSQRLGGQRYIRPRSFLPGRHSGHIRSPASSSVGCQVMVFL